MKQKLLFLLVLLLTATTSAWATPNSIVINGTPKVGDKSISLTYHFDPANVSDLQAYAPTLKVKCAADNKWDETLLSLTEVSSGTTNITLNTLGEFEAGKTYEVCFAYNNGGWVDDVFQTFVPAAAGYTVSLKSDTKDAGKWTVKVGDGQAQALPIGGLKGDGSETVTLQYNGRLKVKGVKATSDAPAKEPATVTTAPTATTGDIVAGSETALVSGGTATGGTMMYKVTTANTKPTSTEGFSDAVPTAKTLEAGTYYVWYYVKADADHANSEISATAIAVTVKAVEGHALSAAAVGEIVGSDGKAYAAANKDNLPEGVEAVAMIWYVNGTHGLALALADEADDDNVMYDWETANTLCNAHTPAITGATWKLATQDDWNNMITGAGGAAALRDGFSSVVGENLQNSPYWSSTNYKWDGYAMHYKFNDFRWEDNGKEYDDFVRACLSW